MLSAKLIENFLSPDQNWANFCGFWDVRVRGFKKLQFLTQKAYVFVNPRRLSHFASKSVEGLTSRSVGEKNKVTETSIGKTCRR